LAVQYEKSPTRRAKLTLVSWIGQTDLNAAQGDATAGIGPIAQAAAFKNFTRLVLLSNYPADPTQQYLDWLRQRRRNLVRSFIAVG